MTSQGGGRPVEIDPELEIARKTRRGFLGLGLGAAGFMGVLTWVSTGEYREGDIPPGLRRVLNFNEGLVRGALYSNDHLAPTFPASSVGKIKVNGDIGIDEDIDLLKWEMRITPFGGGSPSRIPMDAIKTLPRHEQTIDFKCVEGWSTVTQFAGVRLSDFTAKFAPGSERAECVGMKTPDEDYYVGIDMPSAQHPQTLLAYEMNGEPLSVPHGAPLRLVTPVKYGIKNIKQIGSIDYTNARPADYWAERGYDYYAGL